MLAKSIQNQLQMMMMMLMIVIQVSPMMILVTMAVLSPQNLMKRNLLKN
jgi:hypothetical protein